jgi:large subunit ribosomal protein L25
MLKNLIVDVNSRPETGKNVSRRLRRTGRVPAVVYGEHKPPVQVSVDPKAIKAILVSETGGNTLFQLRLDGEEGKTRHVMMRERQRDPVTGHLVHVDFLRVAMDRKVQVEVPLHIVGIADGVKNSGGILDFVVRAVSISCLPAEIPERIDVDVTPLGLGQVFRAKDLALAPAIEIKTDPEQPLVVITTPRAEEVVAPTPVAAVEPEVIAKGKDEPPAPEPKKAEPKKEGKGKGN